MLSVIIMQKDIIGMLELIFEFSMGFINMRICYVSQPLLWYAEKILIMMG